MDLSEYEVNDEFVRSIESKQSEQMKARIENLMDEVKKYGADFLDIKELLKQSHPYKYRKIEDKWIEQLMNAKITVKVESNLQRTYDFSGFEVEDK
ncbi:hypothetical protein D3C73_1431320 [compost metagenome]